MSTGIFDIIGPNMIGPSSSHTAGALRIAYLGGRLIHGAPKRWNLRCMVPLHTPTAATGHRPRFAGRCNGFAPDDLRIRDSFQIARERGLQYSISASIPRPKYPTPIPLVLPWRGRMAIPCMLPGFPLGRRVRLRSWMGWRRPFRRVRYHRGEAVR